MATSEEYAAPDDGTVLYKYRHLEGQHRDWTRRIITDAEIHLATAESFNDPWDSSVRFRIQSSKKEQAKKLDSVLRKKMPHLPQRLRRIEVDRGRLRAGEPERIAEFQREFQNRIYRQLGIFSLSEDPGNILLWSHYAHSHMGLCLGFSATCPFFGRAIPVTYHSEYAQIDPITDFDENAHILLTRKSTAWEYERERRIVDLDGPGLRNYSCKALRLVILGCRLPDRDRECVISWIHQCKHTIDVVQAEPSDSAFRLTFTKIL